MKTYRAAPMTFPLDDSWDVIVVGGGPAGCTAAAAAAREGARTLLLEGTACLGGMGTSGLVPAWTPFSDQQRVIYGGMAQSILNACKAAMPHVPSDKVDWVPIDPECLKRIYDDLLTRSGATVLFHTHLARVQTNGRCAKTLLVLNKSGLTAVQARAYIDCTGDADLCAWAGAEFQKGNADGKKLMPATHCFILANVDEHAFLNGPDLHARNPHSPIYNILRSGKYPLIPDAHLCSNLIGPRTVGFNAGHLWDVDNTQPDTVSAALMHGRKMAEAYRAALAEFHPSAFGNAFLVATGSLMGIRETRRIRGDYMLTLPDYLDRRSFPDDICRNAYFIDVHWAREQAASKPEHHNQWETTCFRYQPGESHGIPYRCLIPLSLDNVLVAGRSISCEQIVQGSIRVMPACLAMGEAAGIAAALAAQSHASVRNVSVPHLRQKLLANGAWLPTNPNPAPLKSQETAETL